MHVCMAVGHAGGWSVRSLLVSAPHCLAKNVSLDKYVFMYDVYIYMYIIAYIYMHVYIYICISMHICKHMFICMHIYVLKRARAQALRGPEGPGPGLKRAQEGS